MRTLSLDAAGAPLGPPQELGRGQFADLESRLGPQVLPHLVRYKRAFIVFFATIGAMLIVALSSLFVKSA